MKPRASRSSNFPIMKTKLLIGAAAIAIGAAFAAPARAGLSVDLQFGLPLPPLPVPRVVVVPPPVRCSPAVVVYHPVPVCAPSVVFAGPPYLHRQLVYAPTCHGRRYWHHGIGWNHRCD